MITILCHGSEVPLLGTSPIPNDQCKIEEIAWHLANINRFSGGAGGYSVAQHSWLCSQLGEGCQFAKLMHDIHESALTDIPTPVKEALDHIGNNAMAVLEAGLAQRFRRRYGLPAHLPQEVKKADHEAARIEIASLFGPETQRRYRSRGLVPLYGHIHHIHSIWDANTAYDRFLERYREIGGGIP